MRSFETFEKMCLPSITTSLVPLGRIVFCSMALWHFECFEADRNFKRPNVNIVASLVLIELTQKILCTSNTGAKASPI